MDAPGGARGPPATTPSPKSASSASPAAGSSGGKAAYFKPKADVTPVPVRSVPGPDRSQAGSFASRFAPRLVSNDAAARRKDAPAAGGGGGGGSSGDVDMYSFLAHSLSLRNAQTGAKADMESLRRASAPGAAAARAGARRVGTGGAASASQKLEQHLQRLKKQKQGRKSLDLSELSWLQSADGTPLYTPIALPFVATEGGDEGGAGVAGAAGGASGGGGGGSSSRPTAKFIDEANRHAAQIFELSAEEEAREKSGLPPQPLWILVQFPAVLPAFEGLLGPPEKGAPPAAPGEREAQIRSAARARQAQVTAVDGLPEGLLGTIDVHRSGRVKLRLGGAMDFDVNQGSDCNFAQEVACLRRGPSGPADRELLFMGRCQRRIVVTPTLDQRAMSAAAAPPAS